MSNLGLEWTVITSAVKLKEVSGGAIPTGQMLIPNTVSVYAKDKAGISNLYWKNDAGTEYDLGLVTSISGGANRIAYFSSATDITSSATFVFDGTSMGLGTATPNYVGFTRTLTIESTINTGLEFASSRADADAVLIGAATAWYKTNSVNHNRIAEIDFVTDGTTANQRGGQVQLLTKPNGSTTLLERVRVDKNGVVVVGGGATQVSASTPAIEVHPASGSGGSSVFYSMGFGAGNFGNFQGRSAGGTSGSPSAVVADNVIARFSAVGYGSTAYASGFRAAIDLVAGETWTDAAQGTYIKLQTTPTGGSVTAAERFRIGPAGQLGIGGATFGTAGQYFRSGGPSAAPTWATIASSEVTPPGSTTQIIFNSAGAFGASANLTWDGTDLAIASGSRFRMQSQNRIRYLNSLVHVTNSADITLTTSTWTVLTWDTETFDTDTMHSTVSNTSRLTAQIAGKYRITLNGGFAAAASAMRFMSIEKNANAVEGGGTILALESRTPDPTVGNATYPSLSCIANLAANDYVEGFAWQDSGANLAFVHGGFINFSMYYIGE